MRATLWSDLGAIGAAGDDDESHDGDVDEGFVRSVRDMIQTGELNAGSADNIALEINGLKFAQNRSFTECVYAMVPVVFAEILQLAQQNAAEGESGL
jgi:hypothetical protein